MAVALIYACRLMRWLRLLPVLAPVLAALPSTALADGEFWSLTEARVPVFGYPNRVPRMSARFIGEFRLAGRSQGLYQGLLRVGPVVDLTSWLVLSLNGVVTADRSAKNEYLSEGRFEIEPLVYGMVGPLYWHYRNRFEFRFRQGQPLQRFRVQVRLSLRPEGWRLSPFVWNELFFGLSGESFNQNRFAAGVELAIRDGMRVDFAYLLRPIRPGPVGSDWRIDHGFILAVSVGPGTKGLRALSSGLPSGL